MHALVDSDTIVFASAVSANESPEWVALSRCKTMLENILEAVKPSTFTLYVSAGNNFRKEIDPSYKANRKDMPVPVHRQACHDYLMSEWGAIGCIDYEADDACGVHQCYDGSTVIVGIDKDLLQIPGVHYQWPIIRKGVVVRAGRFLEISEEEGFRNFFTQVLTGDVSDNIKGVDGIGPKKAAKLLAECKTEEEMYVVVENCYRQVIQDEYKNTDMVLYVEALRKQFKRLETNLNLLWIWRELGVTYSIRKLQNGI